MINHSLKFNTSQEAWEGINEWLFLKEKWLTKNGQGRDGNVILAHDLTVHIHKSWVDPEFNFGKVFGYKTAKWSSLVSNYVDLNYLDLIKADIEVREKKKQRMYNVGFRFQNIHSSGKDCLLSLVFSRRKDSDVPVLVFNVRASEVTKRLLWDLLLVQRMGEYVYGSDRSFQIVFTAPMVFINAESFTMYHVHRDIPGLLADKPEEKWGKFQKSVISLIEKFSNMDPEKLTYRVHRRSVRALQGNPGQFLYAKNCKLVKSDIEYPDDCITTKERKAYKNKLRREGKLT